MHISKHLLDRSLWMPQRYLTLIHSKPKSWPCCPNWGGLTSVNDSPNQPVMQVRSLGTTRDIFSLTLHIQPTAKSCPSFPLSLSLPIRPPLSTSNPTTLAQATTFSQQMTQFNLSIVILASPNPFSILQPKCSFLLKIMLLKCKPNHFTNFTTKALSQSLFQDLKQQECKDWQ